MGSVSPNAMPDCAGCVPPFVRVKTRLVAAVSLMEAAPKVFATLGVALVTTRHWSLEALVAPLAVTFAAALVNAAGLPAQLAFTCVGWLVRPATVTVHEAVPLAIAMPERPESPRVPAL